MFLSLTLVAIARIIPGISSIISPSFIAYAFSLPYHPSASSLSYRWAGSRELVLGGWLWLANTSYPEQLSSVLVVGAIVDAIDLGSTFACILLEGNLNPWALTIVAGGAAWFFLVELWTLSGLSKKESNKVQ